MSGELVKLRRKLFNASSELISTFKVKRDELTIN